MEKQEKSHWMIKIFLKKARSTKLFILYMGFIVVTACNAQKITTMKKFDIESFNKHKDSIRNEYNRILDDGTTIRQWESTNEYIEIIKSKNSYFEESRSFYKNGNLKMYVERFPNQFLKYLIE